MSTHKARWTLRIGRISHFLTPVYSACRRCHTTWFFVEGHNTMITDGRGCFPLCERCWGELTPADRLPFYRDLYNSHDYRPYSWEDVEAAVLREGEGLRT
jgi:hypothetical protein